MLDRSRDDRGRPLVRIDRRGGGPPGRGVSGRGFVVGGVLGLLILWGSLYLLFDAWREGVRERIAFGKERVVPVIEGLADVEPPGVAPERWRRAVAETEAMLAEVVGTGRIDRPGLEVLRSDLARRVAEAHGAPESAPAILGGLWDDMARKTHLRPEIRRPDLIGPTGEGRPGGPGEGGEDR